MTPEQETSILRRQLIAQRALRGYEELGSAQKVELLLGLAEILTGEKADAARATAWAIQTTEAQQMKFRGLLGQEGAR